MSAPPVDAVFAKWAGYWADRSGKQGNRFTARNGGDPYVQQLRIEALLMDRLTGKDRWREALDFGCGWGRLVPALTRWTDHVWAVDVVSALAEQAGGTAPNVTPLTAEWPFRLPMRSPRIGLLWAGQVFQHIIDEGIFKAVAGELGRVLLPGARVLVLDNAEDRAPHVKPRGAERLAAALGLASGWWAAKVTVDRRPMDHWLLDGHKA